MCKCTVHMICLILVNESHYSSLLVFMNSMLARNTRYDNTDISYYLEEVTCNSQGMHSHHTHHDSFLYRNQ